jgi:alkylation response protein AidB-like acyl-CoA dehydrogenase
MAPPDSRDDAAFRGAARAWLSAHATLREEAGDRSDGPAAQTPEAQHEHFRRGRAWQRTLYDGGWAGIDWPRRFGGRGGTAWEAVMFAQEMARFDVTSGFVGSTIGMVGAVLMRHGTPEQQDQFLRPLLRADDAWCQLFSEPAAGSDLANVSTRAVRDGDDFVVNGQKVWTSSAHLCDWALLLARTDVDVPKHKGITFLLLDLGTPGIDIRPLRQITGSAHFNEVFLTDVRVPACRVVGSVDGGWGPARTVLSSEATGVANAETAGDTGDLVRLAGDVGRSGDPLVRQRLVGAHADERVLGLMTDRVTAAVRHDTRAPLHGSAVKVFWSEARVRRDELAVHLLGPGGMLAGADAHRDGHWQTQLLNRFWATIGGGTSEVHRTMIADAALGLPPEPRVDKDVPFRHLAPGS